MSIRVNRKILKLGLAAALYFCLVPTCWGMAKQLEITAAEASVHMQPDQRSPVLAVLSRGDVVTLASPRKFRRTWNYVYFTSPGSSSLKSGYVHDEAVTKLYESVKCITFEENGASAATSQRAVAAPGIHWGMADEEVRNCLGEPTNTTVMNEFRILRYKKDVVGLACNIDYMFSSQDKLVKTRYSFAQSIPEKNEYIADFIKLNEHLEETYGQPQRDNRIWHDPSFKRRTRQMGAGRKSWPPEL